MGRLAEWLPPFNDLRAELGREFPVEHEHDLRVHRVEARAAQRQSHLDDWVLPLIAFDDVAEQLVSRP